MHWVTIGLWSQEQLSCTICVYIGRDKQKEHWCFFFFFLFWFCQLLLCLAL